LLYNFIKPNYVYNWLRYSVKCHFNALLPDSEQSWTIIQNPQKTLVEVIIRPTCAKQQQLYNIIDFSSVKTSIQNRKLTKTVLRTMGSYL